MYVTEDFALNLKYVYPCVSSFTDIEIIFANYMLGMSNDFLFLFRIDTTYKMPKEVCEDPDVTGKNRYKYFGR